MPENAIELHFARLHRILALPDLPPEARQAQVQHEVRAILDALSGQPQHDQQDIRAALFHLGLLPERRSGVDRREQARTNRPTSLDDGAERRSAAGRRHPRDLSQWLREGE